MNNPIVERLRRMCEADSQLTVAKGLGISGAYLNDILRGRRDPGRKLLAAMGYKKRVTYKRISASNGAPDL